MHLIACGDNRGPIDYLKNSFSDRVNEWSTGMSAMAWL
jgi:hypothetical protein